MDILHRNPRGDPPPTATDVRPPTNDAVVQAWESTRARRASARDAAVFVTCLAPVALGLVVAVFCGAALSWDGSGLLFQVLDTRAPVVPHQRWIHIIMQAPSLLASGLSGNLVAAELLYGATWALLPLGGLIASWWIVRERRPELFVWPILSIGIGLLPGMFNLTAEANAALVLCWPLMLATIVGLRRSQIPILVVFTTLLAVSHPYAIGLLFLIAGLALVTRWRSTSGKHIAGLWAAVCGALGILTLIRFALFRTSYEDAQLSVAALRWSFTVGLVGYPAIAVVSSVIVALVTFFRPFVDRRASASGHVLMRLVLVLSLLTILVALVTWAREPHQWWLANKYTYPALPVTLIFIAFAAMDWFRSTQADKESTQTTAHDWTARLRTMQLVSLIFAIVLVCQGTTWFGLTAQLRRTIEASPWNCISMAPLGWLQKTPLDQFATPAYALLLQGQKPERAVLYGNGCGEQEFASGIALNQYYVRPWDQGWFDLQPLRSAIATERATLSGCSFQLTRGWYVTETSDPYWWRWSDGTNAHIALSTPTSGRFALNGQIETSGPPRTVDVFANGLLITSLVIESPGLRSFTPILVTLQAGSNDIKLVSHEPGTAVGDRILAFDVANLTVTATGTGAVCRLHP